MNKELEDIRQIKHMLENIDDGLEFEDDIEIRELYLKQKHALETALNCIENSIPTSVVEEYLKEEQERFNVYKKESKENENLKLGMWKHLGAKNMCEKILGIEKSVVILD